MDSRNERGILINYGGPPCTLWGYLFFLFLLSMTRNAASNYRSARRRSQWGSAHVLVIYAIEPSQVDALLPTRVFFLTSRVGKDAFRQINAVLEGYCAPRRACRVNDNVDKVNKVRAVVHSLAPRLLPSWPPRRRVRSGRSSDEKLILCAPRRR